MGTECINTEGTYWCACKEGYFRDTVAAQFSIGRDDRGNSIYIKARAHRTRFFVRVESIWWALNKASDCDATKCFKSTNLYQDADGDGVANYCEGDSLTASLCECAVEDMCANACYTVDQAEEVYTTILADNSNVPFHNCHQCHPNAECRNNFDYKGNSLDKYIESYF